MPGRPETLKSDTKVTPNREPKNSELPSYWTGATKLLNAPMVYPVNISDEQKKTFPARNTVRQFLASIAPVNANPPALSKDIERLGRVVRSVVQAVNDEILTAEEANAVIEFIADRFTHRRFDQILSTITTPKSGAWFALRGRKQE